MTARSRLDQEGVEAALAYLAESAKEYAEAKGRRVWLEEKRKVIKAQEFSAADGTVAERESVAYTSMDYRQCVDDLRDAVIAEETARAYRVAAEARIEVWRSLESSRRAANV